MEKNKSTAYIKNSIEDSFLFMIFLIIFVNFLLFNLKKMKSIFHGFSMIDFLTKMSHLKINPKSISFCCNAYYLGFFYHFYFLIVKSNAVYHVGLNFIYPDLNEKNIPIFWLDLIYIFQFRLFIWIFF